MDILTSEARDIGRFIRVKRELAKIESFPQFPRRRRHVQHLTQGELAELVGVSTIVISQIEQSRYPNVTAAILQKIANALEFTQQQRIYLLGLLQVRPEIEKVEDEVPAWIPGYVEQMRYPALIVNPVFDVVAVNDAAKAFLSGSSQREVLGDNLVRIVFKEPGMRDFISDHSAMAASVVSGTKMFFAVNPEYRNRIEALGEELSEGDEYFTSMWQQDDPLVAATIEKEFNHPVLGKLNINQILTDIVEARNLTKIDFLPADEATRTKLAEL